VSRNGVRELRDYGNSVSCIGGFVGGCVSHIVQPYRCSCRLSNPPCYMGLLCSLLVLRVGLDVALE